MNFTGDSEAGKKHPTFPRWPEYAARASLAQHPKIAAWRIPQRIDPTLDRAYTRAQRRCPMDALRPRLPFVALAVLGIALITAPVFVNYPAAIANAGEPVASAQHAPQDP